MFVILSTNRSLLFFQYLVSSLAELNTTFALHAITNKCDYYEVEIINHVGLHFPFDGTMLSGIRKFFDYRRICQLFPKSIVDVLTYCLIITLKQFYNLFSCKPYHIFLYLDNNLSLPILCLIDCYLMLSVNICWFHIIKRLLILSYCICHAYPLPPSLALLR